MMFCLIVLYGLWICVHGSFVYIWGLDRGPTINNDNAYNKNRCGLDTVEGVQYFYVGVGVNVGNFVGDSVGDSVGTPINPT